MQQEIREVLFLARFGKHADLPGVRERHLEAHLRYLEERRDRILLSATARLAPEDAALGFIWIVEAKDADEARKLCQEDPFWFAGLRTSFELLHLTKALPQFKALV